MPPKERKTKAQITAAATSGGKTKKKKWSKGKQKEKLNNSVFFMPDTYDKLINDISKHKLITPAVISEKLKVTVSLARQAIKGLEAMNLIKRVGERHHAQIVYTRAT